MPPNVPRPEEVAEGVYRVETGRGLTEANVYLVRSGSAWVLIDTTWAHRGHLIRTAAESLFGTGTRPAAIVLTHIHPDHAGSALELARMWDLPVHVHPGELPLASGGYLPQYGNPLDRWLIAPLLRLMPRRKVAASLARNSLEGTARAFDPAAGVPGLPDWQCIPTPGHTPGHAAYFRSSDRVLITGDAVLTVNLNSARDLLAGKQRASGPPYISTWDWPMAKESVAALARLEPQALASGHGTPMTGATTAAALRTLAQNLGARTRQRQTRPETEPRRAEGFFKPVDYARRTGYRRPPEAYLRFQWLAPLLTTLGITPRDVITLEVPGRRSGMIRRTSLVRATCGGGHYLVALAGESEWVRNVRAAGGRVVIGRRQRHAARLAEVPPQQRAPVIRAYLLRWGRRAGSRAVANEASHYFGVSADASLQEIQGVVEHYPVFRIEYDGPADTRRGWGK
ncbi:MAG TPA: nitroreductase/quinone reductase family protein [Streptosporangiaceae bacterium]|nr:nitroreductase/quinone reductase family protein [Streptosporangiaceae bacterium]